MNLNEALNKIKFPIFLNNFNIKIQNRYIPVEKNKTKREWFITNFKFNCENNNYHLPELIVKFDHIDEDNPEFFLQPGQIIKIIDSKLIEESYKKYILIIYKFKQEKEE